MIRERPPQLLVEADDSGIQLPISVRQAGAVIDHLAHHAERNDGLGREDQKFKAHGGMVPDSDGYVEPHLTVSMGIVHRVARAIAATLPTERMHSMSLGSQQGNAHLHWHLAPLPPGVQYQQQQFHALMAENGVLPVNDNSQSGSRRAHFEVASKPERPHHVGVPRADAAGSRRG
ncbi:hypothetical protein ACFFMM_11625 [Micromonospora chaiyaphumensis]|uniref:HIT domain-containing protein n=1 Tax=Micromonospora chaiyaphumensis TaxID=307119 RepID=A0A1C4W9F5_9ACTN|nr:hypothetical protein [Micromonospora chaiyaphumensis]SCE92867.1 hypothetical protein GA0070214_103360 [Micromonospora chaiyaphumensis]